MVIICGASAWAWYRTPPIVRDIPCDRDMFATGRPEDRALFQRITHMRKNASEAARLLSGRIFTDLKGIPLPVHIMVEAGSSLRPTQLFHPHQMSRIPARSQLIDLGNGLFVTSPELTLAQLATCLTPISLLKALYEACGIYAISDLTPRAQVVLNTLEQIGTIKELERMSGIVAFYDVDGSELQPVSPENDPVWTPTRDRTGKLTNLWKRPPLTSIDRLAQTLSTPNLTHGVAIARRLVPQIINGSGSPLETSVALLMCLPPKFGGEGWPAPHLNQRIAFDERTGNLMSTPSCVADQLWEPQHAVVEVNGFAFHADRMGFALASNRRAALEAMGYTELEITHEHICDLDNLDITMTSCADRLGLPLAPRTARFLARRTVLHHELFPYA